MDQSAQQFTSLLAIIVLLTHIGIVLFFIGYSFFRKAIQPCISHITRNAFTYGLLVSLSAMLGSLYYSDVEGLAPCTLCWYQRIFMYSMVFLFATALFRKDGKVITPYMIVLNTVGGLIALYHSYLQFGYEGSYTCSIGSAVSCTDSYFIEYGYITIPVISLTSFVLIGITLWLKKRANHE